jgi:hypothetical protein
MGTMVEKHNYDIANGCAIINPYITLDMQNPNFPLQLTRITLGPKCREVEVNLSQIKYLLKERGIKACVEVSDIDTYR